jgi:hypothetical protein
MPDREALSAGNAIKNWLAHHVLLLLIIALAVAVRLPGITRGIWIDEAWVANSVLSRTWHDVFYYPNWLQTTPPLLLVLLRAVTSPMRPSELALRAVPFVFGIIAIVVYERWILRCLPKFPAMLSTVLLAFSPAAIIYSQEVKQYSTDLFTAVLLLSISWAYLESPSAKRYLILLVTATVAPALSYPAVFLLPVGLAAILLDDRTARPTRLGRCGLFLAASAVFVAALHIVFIRPNSNPLLFSFWAEFFPPHGRVAAQAHFYGLQSMALVGFLPLPDSLVLKSAVGILLLIGAVLALWRGNRQQRWLAVFCMLPVVAVVGANLLRRYPFASSRLNISLLPCITTCFGLTLVMIWELGRPTLPQRLWQPPDWAVQPAVALVAIVLAGAILVHLASRKYVAWEDSRGALAYVHSHLRPGDVIYLHASLLEESKFYFQMWQWSDAPVRFGDTGVPCCPRATDLESKNKSASHLKDDVMRMRVGDPSRLWFVYTSRANYWELPFVRRDEPVQIDTLLGRLGCPAESRTPFHNVEVTLYRCNGDGEIGGRTLQPRQ